MNSDAEQSYSFEFPRRQYFSLPSSTIFYITTQPSNPKGYQKLQKTCKYFFSKKNIIFLDDKVCYGEDGFQFLCNNNKKIPLTNFQYWFTNLYSVYDGCLSSLKSYIYRLDLTSLSITNQTLSLNDIDFFLTNNKMENLSLVNNDIQDNNGNPISIDYILNKVPNLTNFAYFNRCEIYSNLSLAKLNSVNLNNKLEWFFLAMYETSEQIEAETLFKIIQNFSGSKSRFRFLFKRNSLEIQPIKIKIQELIDDSFPTNLKPTFSTFSIDEIY